MLKVEVTYPNLSVYSKEFPLDAATLFQACVNANSHQLDAARAALLMLEKSACLRIEARSTIETSTTFAGPRLPAISELRKFTLGDAANKLLVNQHTHHFSTEGVHLRYFFGGEFTEDMLPIYRNVFRLGQGESLCVTGADIVDALPPCDPSLVSWEPLSSRGSLGVTRTMRVLRPGLLDDLILYHSARRSSLEVEHEIAKFTTMNKKPILMYRFYQNGRECSFGQGEITAVAGMLRHAVIEQVPATLGEYASNHGKVRVQYLPLPSLGNQYVDGRIRRAVIVDPLDALPLHQVSELRMVSLGGVEFTAVRQTEPDSVFTLYMKPSRRWVSVTPVLLSGFDTKNGRKDERKTRKMLMKELTNVGLEPVSVTTFPLHLETPLEKHGKHYGHVGVALEFTHRVSGMVVAGAGRSSGLGVFASLS